MPETDFGKEDQSPYEIHSKREVMAYLRAIKNHNELVSMAIEGTDISFLTSVLYVSEDNDSTIVLDGAKTESLNIRFGQASSVICTASLDHIKISFTVTKVGECTYDDQPAFLIGTPAKFIRMQRREYYRVSTPVSNPAICHIPVVSPAGKTSVVLPLLDISCGGIAIRDDKQQMQVTPGTLYSNCRLELQGTTVTVTLRICSSNEKKMEGKPTRTRIGCQFVDAPSAVLNVIQRYIMKLECEQKNSIRSRD